MLKSHCTAPVAPGILSDQNSYEGIVGLGADGAVLYANQAAANILGFDTASLLAENAGTFLQALQLDPAISLEKVIARFATDSGNQPVNLEVDFIRHNDHEPRCARFAVSRLQNASVQEPAYLVSLLDTDRSGNNRAIQETEFCASLGHELRTPLNGVTGALDLLGSILKDAQQQRYLKVASSSARLLNDAISDMMDVADLHAGRFSLDCSEFSLSGITDKAMQELAPLALHKGLDYSSRIAVTAPDTLSGDALRLQQILRELLHNAVVFTNNGAVEVCIDCASLDEHRVSLHIQISDSGSGISTEKAGILQALFASDNSAPALQHGGARLGLNLCHQLARLMNARLELDTASGVGSTFSLHMELPQGQPPHSRLSDDSTPEHRYHTVVYTNSAEPAPDSEFVQHRMLDSKQSAANTYLIVEGFEAGEEFPHHEEAPLILVAEDNKVNQIITSETLLGAGYRVVLADNGEEALVLVEKGGIDLVLMDCQMPVLDGFATTRSIRTAERDNGVLMPQQLPIIALTANTARGDREKCLVCGMNDYISKPFDPEFLFEILDQYVLQPPERVQSNQQRSA